MSGVKRVRYSGGAVDGANKKKKAVAKRLALRSNRGNVWLYKMPFPEILRCTVKYSTLENLSSTSGSLARWTLASNNLYDPNATGSGAQPRYFDTLCGAANSSAPYQQYCVESVYIKATFINDNTAAAAIGHCGISPRQAGTTAVSDGNIAPERFGTVSAILSTSENSHGVVVLKKNIDIAKWLSVKDLLDDEEARAVYNASPTKQIYTDMYYQPVDGATTTSVYVKVEAWYHVAFLRRHQVSQS